MKLSVFCGVSVDGFLARLDDTFDFLQTGEQNPKSPGAPARQPSTWCGRSEQISGWLGHVLVDVPR
jgi:hypothetical protein